MKNKYFYIARDKNRSLWLYGKEPIRKVDVFGPAFGDYFFYEINRNYYKEVTWKNSPMVVIAAKIKDIL